MYNEGERTPVSTKEPMTFGAIETKEGRMGSSNTPRLSTIAFEDYLSDYYSYYGSTYKATTTDEYKVIFKKADETTNQSTYWLSSPAAEARYDRGKAVFYVRRVASGGVGAYEIFDSGDGNEDERAFALRPVVVLKSNIHFGAKNANGELTLVEM